ncbi:hypothetical protein PLESTB_001049300 [Pleodorina starrii]|uniref:Guanylate cyclase domain-containing protein n=1 Tax=Pleodorina starrii TaxID=330485 RepID=A0A9W6BQ65_9CHLO|nr:hypothetical protein PLESTB_001049300 [Pleodorina starrii]
MGSSERAQANDVEYCSEQSISASGAPKCKNFALSEGYGSQAGAEAQGLGHWWERWARRSQATLTVLLERPLLVTVSLLVLGALLSAGLAAVLTAARLDTTAARDLALNGIGSQVAASLQQALKTSCFGSELLGAVVVQSPNCSVLGASWDIITADIMSRVDANVVKQLEIDMAGVIWKVFPPFPPALSFLYGRDLLKRPEDRPGMIYSLKEKKTLILGPYNCTEGFKCAFTVTPVFLPAPSEEYDWGCGVQPYNCTDVDGTNLCWYPANKTKYWGQVSTMLNLDPFFSRSDERLVMLAHRGYEYKLWQEHTSSSNPYVLFASSAQDLVDPVVLKIEIENLIWYLELSPAGGWMPHWRDACLVAVVIGSCAVSLLVLWLLVSREQHNRLLRAMLPRKVIRQLQPLLLPLPLLPLLLPLPLLPLLLPLPLLPLLLPLPLLPLLLPLPLLPLLPLLLTPFQVVTLLNELFSVFDELTARNGVYKVETIGDALMCVAGCPVAEEAAVSARRIARMALDMVAAVEQFRPSLEGVRGVQIRVGIHSGPVVAGVVGTRMPRYCLFGDTVNTGSRMESTSVPMRIQVSASTAELLRSLPGDEFMLEPRGPVAVKGKGAMETFFLSETSSPCALTGRSNSLSMIVNRPVKSVTLLRQQSPSPARTHGSVRSGSASRTLLELLAAPNGAAAGGSLGGTVGGGSSGAGGSGGSRRLLAASSASGGLAAAAPPLPPRPLRPFGTAGQLTAVPVAAVCAGGGGGGGGSEGAVCIGNDPAGTAGALDGNGGGAAAAAQGGGAAEANEAASVSEEAAGSRAGS